MKKIILLLTSLGLMFLLSSCDDSTSSGSDELTGTVSGLIIDASTNEPISGVTVRLSNIDENFADSVITNQSGRFSIKDVPVNSAQISFSDDQNQTSAELGNYPYSLHLEMPDGAEYRPNYAFYPIFLTFSSTGGDGNVENLVSSVLLPLPKRNISVTGRLLNNTNREPLSNVTIRAYTNTLFGDGLDFGFTPDEEVFLAETTSGTTGSFQFDALEQGSEIYLKYVDKSDSTKVIDGQSTTYDLPYTETGGAYTKDIGEILVSDADLSSSFYISNISIEEGDDIEVSSETTFEYSFSKPVQQTNYTDDTVPFDIGSNTMIDDILLFETTSKAKDANGNYEIDLNWSDDYKTLTITAIDELLEAYGYRLNTSAFLNSITDNENNVLIYNTDTFAQSAQEAGVIDFTTAGDPAAPSTPSVSTQTYSINWNGGNVPLTWAVNNSQADVAYYEVYTRKDDLNFSKTSTIDVSQAFNDRIDINLPTGLLAIKEQSTFDTSVNFEVRLKAVSENLVKSEFSNIVTVVDNVRPGVLSANYSNSDSTIVATFSEPMNFSTLENSSSYQIIDNFGDPSQDISITDADLIYSTNGITQVTLQLSEQNNTVTNLRLEVRTIITDLAGNGMDSNSDDNNNTINIADIN
ncbi:MAG: carboxypeptidase-like regulatory domain-containing protein [Gracilimonas sp.]|nr:carboxypeptidase-like regulatory domain-containing protein [Gracilimonas sp.]